MISASAFAAGALAFGLGGCKAKKENKMVYRELGKTGVKTSIIGFGAEWMVRHTQEECNAIFRRCEELGVNTVDCWVGDPEVRSRIGNAIVGHRDKWIIQGHVCSDWHNGKFRITRDVDACRRSFEDLLTRLHTDYVDLGMIFLVDKVDEFRQIANGPLADYMRELKACGKIRHIGMSTHNPVVGIEAVKSGLIENMLFCINPAYDILPAMEDHHRLFNDETFDSDLGGIAPERAEFYRLCEANGIGLTVMKAYAGGRLLDAGRSPFKVALTPVQCLHYALTRPAVASIMVGYDNPEQVDAAVRYIDATREERDYSTVLAKAPRHSFVGECTYCDHCAPCSVGIPIGTINKLCDLAKAAGANIPESVREHYASLAHHASECTNCKICERRCPFQVNVSSRMVEAARIFGY